MTKVKNTDLMYMLAGTRSYRCDEDESDTGVVVPPDDAAVGVGDVGGEKGDVV